LETVDLNGWISIQIMFKPRVGLWRDLRFRFGLRTSYVEHVTDETIKDTE
jgi:hypothetical protein